MSETQSHNCTAGNLYVINSKPTTNQLVVTVGNPTKLLIKSVN